MKKKNKDNVLLLELQESFLQGNEQAYSKMWLLCQELSKRLLLLEMKEKKLHFSNEEIEDKISVACLYVLRRYRTRPNYKITNFISSMRFGVIHSLYSQTDKDKANDNALRLDNLIVKNYQEMENVSFLSIIPSTREEQEELNIKVF